MWLLQYGIAVRVLVFFFFSLFPLSWMNELNLNSTSVLLTELFSLEVKDCVVAQCVSILLPMRFFDHFGLAFELLKSTATKLGRSGEVSKQILPSSMETAHHSSGDCPPFLEKLQFAFTELCTSQNPHDQGLSESCSQQWNSRSHSCIFRQ